ncbi:MULTISPECIES: OB-fold nucleic acid binding domain-containing protein [Janibacter]|uniref:OB-fold nucleic acid binding domain-containing protein n=1 Tax=Janibacter TaxID=53457 RepID=UPI000833C9E1|nr:OB-fold nucleic acid binding domain-containing protein [Janibacter terrae]
MSTLLRRLVDLTRSDDDLAAGELREAAHAHGCRPITDETDREVVTVAGTITAVTLRPRATVPALVADLYDGSHTVQLVWLGRRSIRGIDPGAYLKASGLICRPEGEPTIYNPAYELLTHHG